VALERLPGPVHAAALDDESDYGYHVTIVSCKQDLSKLWLTNLQESKLYYGFTWTTFTPLLGAAIGSIYCAQQTGVHMMVVEALLICLSI